MRPPAALMIESRAPAIEIRTNEDLVNALQGARRALATCNGDKAALREWARAEAPGGASEGARGAPAADQAIRPP